MRVIGIETSAATGSVALIINGDLLDERFFTKGMRHGRELVPTVDAIVAHHGLRPEDIDLFAVSQGPGSYTGTRVGVTCAKTLAYALGKKVVGVPSLDVLAENAPASASMVYPAVDAKRERVYFCAYRRDSGGLIREADYQAIPVEEAAAAVEPGGFVLGDAIGLYGAEFAAAGAILADEELWLPRASAVARLGSDKLLSAGPDDPFGLAPIYLHRPEAEEVWEKKQKMKDRG